MAIKLAKAEAVQRLEKEQLKKRVLQIDSLSELTDDHPSPIEYVYNRSLDDSTGSGRGGGRGSGGGGGGIRSSQQAGRGFGGYALRNNEERKPVDTLDLDQFLAETNKSEMRAMYSGRPQGGGHYGGGSSLSQQQSGGRGPSGKNVASDYFSYFF